MSQGMDDVSGTKPSLFYVMYRDHVEFKHGDPSLFGPCVREMVGWLVAETEEALCLTYDRSVKPLPFEKRECGLVLLKSDVLKMKRIKAENTLNCERVVK
jgi:hypothetical protein